MNNSRRGFFKSAFGVLAAGALIPALANAEQKRRPRPGAEGAAGDKKAAGGDLPLLDPKAPQAKAMNYVEKHEDLKNAALKTERQGLAFDKQHCENCSFYTKIDGEKGKCTIFAQNSVKAKAWCSTWNKKA